MTKVRFVIRKTYEIISPCEGIDCIHEKLLKNSFLVVQDRDTFLGILTPADLVESPHRLAVDCLHNKPSVNREADIVSVSELMKESRNSVLPVFHENEFIGVVTQHDITDCLVHYRKDLEQEIAKRTAELSKMIIQLQTEIANHKHTEKALRKSEEKANMQTRRLKELNTALKVFLKQREEDKKELEQKVLSNVQNLVMPYVEELKKRRLNSDQMAYLSVLESNINDIISPFITRLSSDFLKFTPMEIQVANLIKEGKTTKQIGALLHISQNTVLFHRYNLRSKLGIRNKKVNIRSYLQSIIE